MGILKLSEKGKLYTIKTKWFTTNDTICNTDAKDAADDGQYTMESVGGLFIVLIGGVLVSLLIGILEFLWNVEQIIVRENVMLFQIIYNIYFNLINLRTRTDTTNGCAEGRVEVFHTFLANTQTFAHLCRESWLNFDRLLVF